MITRTKAGETMRKTTTAQGIVNEAWKNELDYFEVVEASRDLKGEVLASENMLRGIPTIAPTELYLFPDMSLLRVSPQGYEAVAETTSPTIDEWDGEFL
jgi:hypothetical protein